MVESFKIKEKVFQLDKIDKKILEHLYEDSRKSLKKIAKETGISPDTILYRVNKMKKNKLIRFTVLLNPVKMGFPIYKMINIGLSNFSIEAEKKFNSYLKSNPYVVYVAKTSGNYDYMIALSARSLEHFDEILRGLRSNFSKILNEFVIVDLLYEIKHDDMTGLIED